MDNISNRLNSILREISLRLESCASFLQILIKINIGIMAPAMLR